MQSSINVCCPVCEDAFSLSVNVTFPIEPSGMSGPPENYDPGEGGEVYVTETIPGACPKCRHEYDAEEMKELMGRIEKLCDEFDFNAFAADLNEGPDEDDYRESYSYRYRNYFEP